MVTKMDKNRTRKREKRKDFLRSLCFLSPSLLGVGVFFVLPFCVVLYYSMIDAVASHHFVFLDNFIKLFQNKSFQEAAKNTLHFSVLAVPLAVILAMVLVLLAGCLGSFWRVRTVALSLLLALLLEARIPLKSQFRTFFLSPMMVPVASVVLIWTVLFSENGTVNELLSAFGVKSIDWFQSDYAFLVVVLLFLWKNLGYNMILFMAGLANIPRELLEVADVEGAGEWYKFFAIKLRYLSPTLLFVTILSIINSFKVFREIYLLTGDYPAELYMLQHYMNGKFQSLDYPMLSAAAVVLAIVMVVLILFLFAIENWFGKDVEG